MSLEYNGQDLVPGMGAVLETVERQVWWNRHELQWWTGGIIDATTVDSGHTSNTTQLRPGLILGMITATKRLIQWNPQAVDGSQAIHSIFAGNIELQQYGTAAERFTGQQLIVGGGLKAADIIVPGQTTYGLAGQAWEFMVRNQLAGRFFFDDDLDGSKVAPKTIQTAAAAVTVTLAQNNTTFLNVGATATTTFTLPAPVPGLRYKFRPMRRSCRMGCGQSLLSGQRLCR